MKLKKVARKPIIKSKRLRQSAIDVSDSDIRSVETLLLPGDAHFADDAREVIGCWESKDVSACPGSGKTTVLLAKLKLLADRMPFEDNSGICVLSHTNVAVDEIKEKLGVCAERLLSYPNYIGTIQTFIDKYVTLPYLKREYGVSVRPVDDRTYAVHALKHICDKRNNDKYQKLKWCIKNSYNNRRGDAKDLVDFCSKLYIREDGALCNKEQKIALAGAGKPSAEEFNQLLDDLLTVEGIIKYQEAFEYAKIAIEELSDDYTSLFSIRFKYVFIDEYQDCKQIQRDALERIFDRSKSCVMYIGDPDQAIYNSRDEDTDDWMPEGSYLSISSTNRFGQEVADILSPLKNGVDGIVSSKGNLDFQPTVIVFNDDQIEQVLPKFIRILDENGLDDPEGCYKAVGFIQSEDTAGITIGSYWSGYEARKNRNLGHNYWEYVDEICGYLIRGKLYKAEHSVRELLCRLFHYVYIKDADSGKEFTVNTIREALRDEYYDIYRDSILELSEIQNVTSESVHIVIRGIVDDMIKIKNKSLFDVDVIPPFFIEKDKMRSVERSGDNIFTDPLKGRKIEFGTVHSVKGQTHDATLYLETDYKGGSDIARTFYCYGIRNKGKSLLYDCSRKIAYVGMSRPKKLLCVAMRKKTFDKGKKAYKDWRIVEV